ncbi:MAG: helix-hairpin-helix domain-containing protein [Actinomycetota bacterium]|nr:helix-hairpin-helix domain-containing protein [Actinomycetota bacterium]
MPERRPKEGTPDGEMIASAAILAIEKDLEREHERAASSLEELRRRLERTASHAAEAATADTRGEALEALRKDELAGELERASGALRAAELALKQAEEAEAAAEAETRVHHLASLNDASFEQLRGMGISVMQATRVIAYRERRDGFDSIDDLDSLPGFPRTTLAELKQRLSA